MTRTRRHARRVAVIALAVVALLSALLTAPTPSSAWSNGKGGGNSYGTHDWVLDQAEKIAVSRGQGWVDLQVALPATDDPDTVLRDFYYHVYTIDGDGYGDAPGRVASVYAEAVRQLRAGDRTGASHTVGLLAHYFADVNNPLHTGQTDAERKIHSSYEQAAQRYTDSPGESASWVTPAAFVRVRDPRSLAVTDAQAANRSYSALVSEFSRSGFDGQVRSITMLSLDRAVNGLADLIGSIQLDAGTKTPAVGPGGAAPSRTVEAPAREAAGSADDTRAGGGSGAADATGAGVPDAAVAVGSAEPPSGAGSWVVAGFAGGCCATLIVLTVIAALIALARRRRAGGA